MSILKGITHDKWNPDTAKKLKTIHPSLANIYNDFFYILRPSDAEDKANIIASHAEGLANFFFWIADLPSWDGHPRLNTLLTDSLGLINTERHQELGKTLITDIIQNATFIKTEENYYFKRYIVFVGHYIEAAKAWVNNILPDQFICKGLQYLDTNYKGKKVAKKEIAFMAEIKGKVIIVQDPLYDSKNPWFIGPIEKNNPIFINRNEVLNYDYMRFFNEIGVYSVALGKQNNITYYLPYNHTTIGIQRIDYNICRTASEWRWTYINSDDVVNKDIFLATDDEKTKYVEDWWTKNREQVFAEAWVGCFKKLLKKIV